ncbi:hypothetical protein NL676_004154 [Syzygium grande]|nr:hypothetical protein NL676_004154 [Syzygium grande]
MACSWSHITIPRAREEALLVFRSCQSYFHIYLCSTPVSLTSIKPKISEKYSSSIELVELHLPSLPDLPPHYHTTKGLSPCLMNTLKAAFDMASTGFSDIIKNLSPYSIVYDSFQSWALEVARLHKSTSKASALE